ncbi:hypothetical protein [Burkholderia pseudomallei]|uniref:hypothetical protein n=1 Tax=Burkholderia pseudomallei TaxID=28450 RepID=UPI000F26126A|nr:hypothetical protein [Burkholderia pseudomallei]CAJ3073312.1 Uncharacterised protein [Burkholderia pseudomallei]VCK72798.1 Uncharacterised protein [Burkholderia pseudomallei]VCK79988.1 Uncharacterised protein [Burkholderia pseudomallei]VCK80025.1 Uncharacterised protein [Burkholderia pseudomallei]VCK80762.1 Uncharacterised protein [Burkholderia pseudomallei]
MSESASSTSAALSSSTRRAAAWAPADALFDELFVEGPVSSVRDYVLRTATIWAVLHRDLRWTWPAIAAKFNERLHWNIKPATLSEYLADATRAGLVDERAREKLAARVIQSARQAQAEKLRALGSELAPPLVVPSAPRLPVGSQPTAPVVPAPVTAPASASSTLVSGGPSNVAPSSRAPVEPTRPFPSEANSFGDAELFEAIRQAVARKRDANEFGSAVEVVLPNGETKPMSIAPPLQKAILRGEIDSLQVFNAIRSQSR